MRNSLLSSIVIAAATLGLSPAAHASCSNAYFPSGAGSSWTYDNKGDGNDEGNYTMTVTKNDGTNVTMHVQGEMKDPRSGQDNPLDTDLTGTCTSDGLKIDFGQIMAGHGGGMQMKTVSQEGVAFPPADKLKPGYTWTDSRTIEMSGMQMPPQAAAHMAQGQGGGMQMSSTTTHTVVGNEKVTTPAGSFDALKITEETTMQMPGMAGGGPGGAGGMKTEHTTWLAKGVGIVKSEGTVMGHTHTQELTKYTAK